jgi:maleylpyruvate isomerase
MQGWPMKLHSYFRSSASYRVRIALNLKGVAYETLSHHLRRGEQNAPEYRALQPQGFVPALETDGAVLIQSLAICEYLDEVYPQPPLLPKDPILRARVRAFAQVICCDIHPIQNLKVLRRLRSGGFSEDAVNQWAAQVIAEGFDACEKLIEDERGPFCFGENASLADICLVPQLANARRFKVELRWPRLLQVETACKELVAFRRAAPDQQPDAESE